MSQFSNRLSAVLYTLWRRTLEILKHPLFWIVLLGLSVRLYGVAQFPVEHDEIISILDGVNKTKVSPIHFFFRASLKHTLSVTPLYFWVERLFTDILGQNNWGLRFFPLLSGAISTGLVYYVVREQFNKDIAVVSAFIAAFFDLFIWVTSKCQFFEALVIPLFLPIFYLATSESKNRSYYISLFFALIFLTHFGRGVFLLLCFLVWYALTRFFELGRLGIKFRDVLYFTAKEMLQLSTFLWVIPVWIVSAQLLAFYRPISNVVGGGEIHNIWEALYNYSFGYGVAIKQEWVGSFRAGFLLYNNTNIWPVTTLLFVPFVLGMVTLIKDLVGHWKNKRDRLFKRDSFMAVFALIPLFLLFSRGIMGDRYHLFYFLPFVVSCSMALLGVVSWFQDDRKKWLSVIFVFLLGTYAAYSSSWANWVYSAWDEQLFYRGFLICLLITLAFGAAAFLTSAVRVKVARGWVASFLLLLAVSLLLRGPLVWGTEYFWSPAIDNKLNYLEGDEDTVIDFAVQRNRPELCYNLPPEYKEQCLSLVKGQK